MTNPIEVRLERDEDGDPTAAPVDGSSCITRVDGAPGDPDDYFQIDTGPGPGDPMTEAQVRALMAACRLVLEENARVRPARVPALPTFLLPPLQGPQGLDVDYSAEEARRWAAAETGARVLDESAELLLTLTLLEDGSVLGTSDLLWASEDGVRRWSDADYDAAARLADAGLIRDLAVTDLGRAALDALRDREREAA